MLKQERVNYILEELEALYHVTIVDGNLEIESRWAEKKGCKQTARRSDRCQNALS